MHVVIDIETEPFNDYFKNAKTNDERRQHAPKPRLICIYTAEKKRCRFFAGDDMPKVVPILTAATKIITYNGEGFDFLVLENHCGLTRDDAFRARCVDMYLMMIAHDANFRISLHRAARLNLGVGKKVLGSVLATAPMHILKKGCRSDVMQTFALFDLWQKKALLYPVRAQAKLPTTCPECRKPAELLPFRPLSVQMTPIQKTAYETGQTTGTCGYAICSECRKTITWGF